MKQLLDVTIVVASVDLSGTAPYAYTNLIRLDWTGTLVELEHFLSRSKRVAAMERVVAK
jgi:hypothetical protein